MSIPIQDCLVYRAALGNENAYERLVKNMEYNLSKGHFTTWECNHTPPCPMPTLEQFEALDKRLTADLKERRQKKATTEHKKQNE